MNKVGEGGEGTVVTDVVHQYGDVRVIGEHRLREASDVLRFPDVDDVRAGATALRFDLRDRALAAFGIDLGDLDRRAVSREESRDRTADAVASARHDRDAAVEEAVPVFDGGDVGRLLSGFGGHGSLLLEER